jgi:hypothetical protein
LTSVPPAPLDCSLPWRSEGDGVAALQTGAAAEAEDDAVIGSSSAAGDGLAHWSVGSIADDGSRSMCVGTALPVSVDDSVLELVGCPALP